MNRIPLIIACSLSLACAQEIVTLEKIDVQASAETLEERKENSIAKRIVRGEELTQYGDLNALEILKRTPGVTISEGKGKKGAPGKGYTKVLIDGEEVSTASRRGTPLEQISPEMIERIEIMTNGSSEYTAEAMGGIVNIVLKKPKGESVTNAKISGGAYNKQPMGSAFAQYEGRTGNLSQLINVSVLDNSFKDDASIHIANADGSSSDKLIDLESRYRMVNLNTKLVYAPSPKDKYSFDGSLSMNEHRTTTERDTYDNGASVPSETLSTEELRKGMMLWAKVSGEHHLSGTEMAEWKIKYHQNDQKSESRSIQTVTNLQEDESRFRVLGIEGSYSSVIADHFIKTGLDVRHAIQDDDVQTYTDGTLNSTTNEKMRQTKGAIYLQDEISLGENAVITPGIRYEKVSRQFTTDWDLDYFAPSLHFLYRVSQNDNLRASVAKTVKLPTFQELSTSTYSSLDLNDLNHPDITGNPTLKEESALSYEARYEHYFDDKGIVGIGGFYRAINDKIEKLTTYDLTTSRYIERPYNAGEGSLWGIELELKKSLNDYISGLGIFGNATFQNSSLTTEGFTRPIKGINDYLCNVGIDHTLSDYRITYGAAYRYVGGYDDPVDENGIAESQKGYGSLDLYATKRIDSTFKVGVNLKNMTSTTIKTTTNRYDATTGAFIETQVDKENSEPQILLTLEGRW